MANFRKDTQTFGPAGHDKTVFEVPMIANKNGEVVTTENPFPVTITQSIGYSARSTTNDAFGRLRVSNAFTIFDSNHRYSENSKWSSSTTGSSVVTVSHNANDSTMELLLGTQSGDKIVRETKRVFTYQPGKSLLVLNTFCFNEPKTYLRQRVGYYGVNDGIYLEQENNSVYVVKRSSITGSPVNTRVLQQNWNIDTMDGSGSTSNPSGYDLDLTKSQIFWSDFEWLGVGTVRIGFVINGQFIPVHAFHHANQPGVTTTYMRTATLPIRYEIENTDATASSSTMKQICSSIISEGGFDKVAQEKFARRTAVKGSIGTTFLPLVSFRLKSARLDSVVIPSTVNFMGIAATGSSNYEVVLVKNGTLGGSPSWNTSDFENVEYDVAATSITIPAGSIVKQFFATSTNQAQTQVSDTGEYNKDIQLGRTLAGVSDVYTLCCRTLSGTNSAIGGLGFYDLTH